jgi:hypothetical protein
MTQGTKDFTAIVVPFGKSRSHHPSHPPHINTTTQLEKSIVSLD